MKRLLVYAFLAVLITLTECRRSATKPSALRTTLPDVSPPPSTTSSSKILPTTTSPSTTSFAASPTTTTSARTLIITTQSSLSTGGTSTDSTSRKQRKTPNLSAKNSFMPVETAPGRNVSANDSDEKINLNAGASAAMDQGNVYDPFVGAEESGASLNLSAQDSVARGNLNVQGTATPYLNAEESAAMEPVNVYEPLVGAEQSDDKQARQPSIKKSLDSQRAGANINVHGKESDAKTNLGAGRSSDWQYRGRYLPTRKHAKKSSSTGQNRRDPGKGLSTRQSTPTQGFWLWWPAQLLSFVQSTLKEPECKEDIPTFERKAPLRNRNSFKLRRGEEIKPVRGCLVELPSEDEKGAIVRVHNRLRRKVARGEELLGYAGEPQPKSRNMMAMGYSSELEKMAADWASSCTQSFDRPYESEDFRSVWQAVLYRSSSSPIAKFDLALVTLDRYQSTVPMFYGPDAIQPFYGYNSQTKDDVRPYAIIVNHNTRSIGCAQAAYFNATDRQYHRLAICNYGDGFTKGEPLYDYGEPCDAVPKNLCDDGLIIAPPGTSRM